MCKCVTYEEEGGNECDWDDGLTHGELRSTSDTGVVNALPSSLLCNNLNSRRATALLLMDLVQSRLLGAAYAEELHHLDG